MAESPSSKSLLYGGMRPETARSHIKSFSKRFGEAHLYMAQHAAFPLALTPDLLYRLWVNFQWNIHNERLNIPWVAVADLLLSSLCDEVGYGLYEMNVAVRDKLLEDLKANSNFGKQRIEQLSNFLLVYIRQQLESHDPDVRDFAKAQQWTALAYTRPDAAACELALALNSSCEYGDKTEQIRIASLIETFAEQLEGFTPLLTYARGVEYLARGDTEGAIGQFTEIAKEKSMEVEGVRLQIPEQVLREIGKVRSKEIKRRQVQSTSLSSKLLVVTVGTLAAGVGLELMRQLEEHPTSKLHLIVRYIDTAYLPTRYSELRSGEWFQMTISPQFMDNVRRNQEKHPHLKDLLYPGLLPQIAGFGSGSLRYNAAGAIVINRPRMEEWLTANITDLAKSGEQIKFSIALVVSAVGATGSGTLERLVDIIVECAQNAKIPTLHCDVFILQPGMGGVTDLGLANTFALYAEMAASRLSESSVLNKFNRWYWGRTLMVGWGSEHRMASLEQLIEAAATLIRLTNDPATGIVEKFQASEGDNHVLRELDWYTHLPSHLSSATVVTISLVDLAEKIIQRDAVRLIDTLVFGGKPPESATGEYFIPGAGKTERQAGPLVGALTGFLQGETPEERYNHLIGRLTEMLTIASFQTTTMQLKNRPVQRQASRLRSLWQVDKEEVIKRGRQKMQEQGAALANAALNNIRRVAMATGLSLRDLRDEYRYMENILLSTLAAQQESSPSVADDNEVMSKINALERATFGKERALQQALGAVQVNLDYTLRREAHTAAVEVLKLLQNHCAESLHNLEIILQKLLRQRKNSPEWNAADGDLSIDMSHLLHMAALSTPEEITRYTNLVSIFATQGSRREMGSNIGRLVAGEEQKVDQLAAFRKWLDDQGKLDALFAGEIDVLLELAQNYARQYVHAEIRQHSVVDALLQTGEEVLLERFKEAAERVRPLISFNEGLAQERREDQYVTAYYKNERQRRLLQRAIDQAFGQGRCVLLSSNDPSEIAVFYYVDGLPMSAVTDLTGRCLEAFLRRRRAFYRQNKTEGNVSEEKSRSTQRFGVPVYSGRDAEQRVIETGVIRQLYGVRGQNVDEYSAEEISELADDTPRM